MPRLARLLGGPETITRREVRLLGDLWAPSVCARPAGAGEWLHFTHAGRDAYEYLAPCEEILDHSPVPAEWCAVRWETHPGPGGRHDCTALLPHAIHVCCCSATIPADQLR